MFMSSHDVEKTPLIYKDDDHNIDLNAPYYIVYMWGTRMYLNEMYDVS